MTDEEFAKRAKDRGNARDVDNARTGTFRSERQPRLQLHLDGDRSPDGRVPALTPAAQARPRAQGSFGVGPWEKVQDFSLYDRCITRDDRVVHACRVRQRRTHRPDARLCRHQLRDGARHARDTARRAAGNRFGAFSSGWVIRATLEGDTLVVESRNFTERTAVGGTAHSEGLRMVERFRIDPEMIDYEIRIDDLRHVHQTVDVP